MRRLLEQSERRRWNRRKWIVYFSVTTTTTGTTCIYIWFTLLPGSLYCIYVYKYVHRRARSPTAWCTFSHSYYCNAWNTYTVFTVHEYRYTYAYIFVYLYCTHRWSVQPTTIRKRESQINFIDKEGERNRKRQTEKETNENVFILDAYMRYINSVRIFQYQPTLT